MDRTLIHSLREKLQRFETEQTGRNKCIIRSGCAALDRLLPAGGFSRGSLIECLSGGGGAGDLIGKGVGTFALLLAREALRDGGTMVVLDRRQQFYPPAAVLLGIDLKDVVVIRSVQAREGLWAIEQALRCPAVAAVWAPIERLAPHDFRRLQIAAETGGGLGLLIRCGTARGQPSWSDIQLMIQPCPTNSQDLSTGRRLRIEITRCRHGRHGSSIELDIDETTGRMRPVESSHETHTLHLASQLAYPASGGCSA